MPIVQGLIRHGVRNRCLLRAVYLKFLCLKYDIGVQLQRVLSAKFVLVLVSASNRLGCDFHCLNPAVPSFPQHEFQKIHQDYVKKLTENSCAQAMDAMDRPLAPIPAGENLKLIIHD